MHTRTRFYARERDTLAPFASHAEASRGRRHAEAPHPLRTDFQRDRDRIIHSRAFRRLEYKTQVWVTGSDDHFRTRLTHTIEVAGIARTLARCLGLNEDLAEAIAFAHDLGHPPFGHCGERALNRLLEDHGGFDHNRQALKVVDELELKYPDFPGLNLTWEVRAGLVKHRSRDSTLDGRTLPPQPSLEAQVADLADDLTYMSHDLDDGICAGLLDATHLSGLELWRRAEQRGRRQCNRTSTSFQIRNLIDLLVDDAITTSEANIANAGVASADTPQTLDKPLVAFSPEIGRLGEQLQTFLFNQVYLHPAVDDDNQRAVRWMCELYHYLIENPGELDAAARDRVNIVGDRVAVADSIGLMTDRRAIEEYRRRILKDPESRCFGLSAGR